MNGYWKDGHFPTGPASIPLCGAQGGECSPDWGLGRVMWSWGLGCMRTKGSSTETSLGKERGGMKRTTTNPQSHRMPQTRLSLYSPASRHHQLHLDSVGHQDS